MSALTRLVNERGLLSHAFYFTMFVLLLLLFCFVSNRKPSQTKWLSTMHSKIIGNWIICKNVFLRVNSTVLSTCIFLHTLIVFCAKKKMPSYCVLLLTTSWAGLGLTGHQALADDWFFHLGLSLIPRVFNQRNHHWLCNPMCNTCFVNR